MPDRTINFGESESEATYQIQDTDGAAGGGNFVVAKDTNANTVLLEYDPASDTWEYAGDVDMNGGNVSGVGTLTADSVNTEEVGISNGSVIRNTVANRGGAIGLERHASVASGGGTVQLFSSFAEPVGFAMVINETDADMAMFAFDGGFGSVHELHDPGNVFSTTQGTSSSTNVFNDGSAIMVENTFSNSKTYHVIPFAQQLQ